jgi:Tol biopolymer transport system component
MQRFTLLMPIILALAVPAAAAVPAVPNDSQPWWSPNGSAIAFQRESPELSGSDVFFTPAVRGAEVDIIGAGRARGFRPGEGQLLVELGTVTSIRDAQDRKLATVAGTDATWSPDGSEIAYFKGDTLWLADAAGADLRSVAIGVVRSATDVTGPVWSPDGKEIALSTATQLLAVAADGSGSRSLYEGDNANPSWSFDGSKVAFESAAFGRWTIWLADGTGGRAAAAAVEGSGNNRFPQWSPTASDLAFLSDRDGGYALYVARADGSAPSKLVSAVEPDSPPRWSPPGTQIAVAAAPECQRFGIYVVSLQGAPLPSRRSNQCRINGTSGADTLYGTPYFDIIHGFGGNDALFGGGGNDVIYGGAGNDQIGGGPGNDVIYGGPGNDILSGGPGNDTIYAGPGRDKIGCGPGNDTAYIGPGDTVRSCEHVHRSQR